MVCAISCKDPADILAASFLSVFTRCSLLLCQLILRVVFAVTWHHTFRGSDYHIHVGFY